MNRDAFTLAPPGLRDFERLAGARPEMNEMEQMECQYHGNCGGWCETDEERDQCLCCHCLEAEREEDAERQHAAELEKAMQRIAVAAGIELAQPGEVADIVCARLAAHNAEPSRELKLRFGESV